MLLVCYWIGIFLRFLWLLPARGVLTLQLGFYFQLICNWNYVKDLPYREQSRLRFYLQASLAACLQPSMTKSKERNFFYCFQAFSQCCQHLCLDFVKEY